MSRVIVLGLDAFHEDLLNLTPNIEDFYRGHPSGPLESTIPPVTAPAWASFQTGCNQGKHGIYDFVSYDDNWNLNFLDGADLRAKTFYEYLDESDYDCLLYNLPFTLPGRIDGDIVPSWLDPDASDPIPNDLYAQYEIEPPKYPELKGSRVEKIGEMRESFEHNSQQFLSLLETENHDFLFQLISVTDWVQHNGYRELEMTPNSDVAAAVRTLFTEVDDYVSRVHSALNEDDTLILMSDHGFRLFDGRFSLNDWLTDQGLLTTGGTSLETKEDKGKKTVELGPVGQVLAKQEWLYPVLRRVKYGAENLFDVNFDYESGIDFEESVAYSLSKDECAIRIKETLSDRRQTEIIDMILEGLEKEDGITALRGSNVYSGPYANKSGDVIVKSESYRATRGPVGRIRTGEPVGYHSQHGLFAIVGSENRDCNISDVALIDIAPTILAHLDIPVPESMDGSPIPEFIESYKHENYPEYKPEFSSTKDCQNDTVEERLNDLGYL